MQESNAVVLEILKQESALKMSVFQQKDISSTLRHYSICNVTFTEIDRLCQEIILILNRNLAYGEDLSHVLAKTGQLLWEHLLTRIVKDKLNSAQAKDLILSIDEELIGIPWELLHNGRNFLCLTFNLGRLVRTKMESGTVTYRSFAGIPKMLVLANPTNDLKSAYIEGLNIKNQFDRKRNNLHIDFKSTCIDKLYVKKNISEYDIVHFAGHCEYEPDNQENSGWILSDGRFTVEDILTMGSTASLPSLVFSNACYSAKNPLSQLDSDYQENNYSLAQAFLFSGVRHYLGAIRKIEDSVSLAFAKEFYSQLIYGKSVGESVRLSRLKLVKEYGMAPFHWANYLLYGDPEFILFKTRLKATVLKKKRNILLYKKYIIGFSLALALISIGIYLWMWLPTVNPNTCLLYLRSKKSFQKGDNQEVISLSSRIIQKDPLFLAAYPLLADTYQRIGDREHALKYYFDYALLCEKRRDKKNLASAYNAIGWFYHLDGQYPKALDFYNKAISLAVAIKDKLNEAVSLRKLAVWNMDNEEYDKALELLTKSSEINRGINTPEHRYNLACDYFDIGLVFVNKNDFIAAKEFYGKSGAIFEKLKLKNELSDYYFNLGEINLFEKQYRKALDNYMAGLKIDEAQGNKLNLASDYNMIGELYVEMDKYSEAEDYFNRSVLISQEISARPELASACYNLGILYKKAGKINKARDHLRRAQEIYSLIDKSSYEEAKRELLDLNGS